MVYTGIFWVRTAITADSTQLGADIAGINKMGSPCPFTSLRHGEGTL